MKNSVLSPLDKFGQLYVQKTEFKKDIEFRQIKNLSGFKGFTSDYRS